MKTIAPALHLLIGVSFAATAFAESAVSSESPFYYEEPPQGGLIFQERDGPEADVQKAATGSRYTTVGIIQHTGGGPYVMESTPESGVTVTQIDEFVRRGVDGRYAIYEVEGISAPPDWYHPFVERYYDFIHLPFDPFYTATIQRSTVPSSSTASRRRKASRSEHFSAWAIFSTLPQDVPFFFRVGTNTPDARPSMKARVGH